MTSLINTKDQTNHYFYLKHDAIECMSLYKLTEGITIPFFFSFSGTSPNQNFVKNPDVQDMGLSSSSVDGGEGRSQPAAAAASDGRAAWKGAELAALLTAAIVVATLNTNWSL